MMGGLGSGRPSGGGRLTTDACRALDIAKLNRDGVLTNGWRGTSIWTRNGETVASISICGGAHEITLTYRWRRSGDDWEDVIERVRVLWSPCRYGGERPYFECPGVVNGIACRRRIVKLYGPGRYFVCRHCLRLTYASRNEDSLDRGLRRANRIRMSLGGEPGLAAAFPRRPKGMWHKTYDRLAEEAMDLESRSEERLYRMMSRLMAREERGRHRRSRRAGQPFWGERG